MKKVQSSEKRVPVSFTLPAAFALALRKAVGSGFSRFVETAVINEIERQALAVVVIPFVDLNQLKAFEDE